MPRLARIAVANIPYHVTQRGNARQFLLASESEKTVYLERLREYLALYQVSLLGYCWMSNHVHLVVVPAWCAYLQAGETEKEVREVRRCTHTGRPLGADGFVQGLQVISLL